MAWADRSPPLLDLLPRIPAALHGFAMDGGASETRHAMKSAARNPTRGLERILLPTWACHHTPPNRPEITFQRRIIIWKMECVLLREDDAALYILKNQSMRAGS